MMKRLDALYARLFLLVIAPTLILGSAASGQDGSPADPDTVDPKTLVNPIERSEASARAGKQVYTRLCVTCHGMDGKGAPGAEEHLPAPPSDLTDGEWKYGGSDGELFTVIREGTDLGMESFKDRFDEQRTWHVVNYLRSLAPDSEIKLAKEEILENPIPADVDSIRRGRFLYDSHCALCHADDGSGYTDYLDFLSVPPADFTTGEFKYGGEDGQIFVVIRDGTGSKDMVAFGDRLNTNDIWDLVNYVKRFAR